MPDDATSGAGITNRPEVRGSCAVQAEDRRASRGCRQPFECARAITQHSATRSREQHISTYKSECPPEIETRLSGVDASPRRAVEMQECGACGQTLTPTYNPHIVAARPPHTEQRGGFTTVDRLKLRVRRRSARAARDEQEQRSRTARQPPPGL